MRDRMRATEMGFSFVSLAIALMVVGLVLGGLLKGGELTENTRINSTIRQVQSYDAAVSTFRDTYGSWPGDMPDPDKRLKCASMLCAVKGNGDNFVGVQKKLVLHTYRPQKESEERLFWFHLAITKLVSGVETAAKWSGGRFGVEFPKAAIGGGYTISGYKVPAHGLYPNIAGNYLRLWERHSPVSPVLNGRKAHLFDTKMDDGVPVTGIVLATGDHCLKGNEYNDGYRQKACVAYIRLQNDLPAPREEAPKPVAPLPDNSSYQGAESQPLNQDGK